MATLLPNAGTLTTLLRLLDDDTPEVRRSIANALQVFGGDVSELLNETGTQLSTPERKTLSNLLRPARRERLRRDWIVPSGGIAGLEDDWDRVESLLRVLSDYLHDGITVRQPLGDALDLVSDAIEPILETKGRLAACQHLLGGSPFRCAVRTDLQSSHLDLAGVASGELACALGIGIALLLVLRRLGASVEGLSLPGTFFIRVDSIDGPIILDPEQGGAPVSNRDFEHRIRRYPKEIQSLCRRAATPGELLVRVTEELAMALAFQGDGVDGDMMEELVESLIPSPF